MQKNRGEGTMLFRRIQQKDMVEINQLFKICMVDLIARENKDSSLIEEEVENLKQVVQENFTDPNTIFYVTEIRGRIAGTIALTKPNSLISENVPTEPDIYEIACVYVHPDEQRQGVGKFMFQRIKQELMQLGQKKYCLDAGYISSQQYWEGVLGKPTLILEDYWGEGEHHLVWIKSVSDS